jgi:phthalate 4,5-cis-dihydrodiol dehydrogenase
MDARALRAGLLHRVPGICGRHAGDGHSELVWLLRRRRPDALGSLDEQHKGFVQRQKTRQGLVNGTRSEADYRERRVGGKRDSGRSDRTGEREWAADMGMVIVSCERGDMRQSPSGVYVYTDKGLREVKVSGGTLWAKEEQELYDAVVNGRRGFHSGQSAIATIEVILAIVESSRTHREVVLTHQMVLADVVPQNLAIAPDEVVELT